MAALAKGSVVAVIGSGAMGSGIAQVAAASGYTVKLFDTRAEAVDKAIADIGKVYGKLVEKGKMSATDADAARARLQAVASLGDLADAGLAVEAIVENLDVKRSLFADLEGIVADDAILATNTSSISVTAIAAKLRKPQRLVGMHFFNPVPLMALVEVISGLATGRDVAETVYDTAIAWGKNPVHAKSTPGFIVNRVARPYYAEGWRLLNEQASDAATIDAVMREGGGFRMGPFELMDLIGHDVNYSVTESVFRAYYNDPRFTPSVMQQEMVNAGFLGRKSGRGFYDYSEGASAQQPRFEAPQPLPEYIGYSFEPGDHTSIATMLIERLKSRGVSVTKRNSAEGHRSSEAPAFHCNGAAIYLTDGRTATQRARDDKHADMVVYDLVFDFNASPRIAIACSDQCSPRAMASAIGMFQAAGFTVTRLDDVPGLAVMRTVAMLANEAADAVNQGVCSAQAADVAMQKGVNYPRGPLAWADLVGVKHIVTVLENLASSYGEDRYRVSPLLRRREQSGARIHA
ncbi:3-hydroxyacyl-CoA dehydrogenase PaaH [Duganella sp. Root1480D1]|uniref:3-hydroxyacyl-CoA dehydrogenase PaaH n=1 Tax=Duganella sp. Root1480D1 TaxID=1736471 RepID=UPI000709E44F|nr:3-hydroxyacyl-CoA dehydrogenase PaaH [Duganella sp. Root1480D1]KQZ42554.1 3-hydroxyacyl-CoA dehydrogenase [Duganella sp. Root1480D1]